MSTDPTTPVDHPETEEAMTATLNDTDTDTDTDAAAEAPTERVAKKRKAAREGEPEAPKGRSISVATLVRGGIVAAVVAAVIAGFVILGVSVHDKSQQLNAVAAVQSDSERAEKVALDYAQGAADVNYQDFDAWTARLTKGTSPELSERLRGAATSLQSVLGPVQWVATAQPIAAKVLSHNGDVYEVACFVDVLTKNAQTPDGLRSTATYKLTMDRSKDWQITAITDAGTPLDQSTPK